ncbi:MAG: shikimate kinase [Pseudomonadota bacterium]
MNTATSQDVNRAVIADRSSTIRRALGGRSIVLVGIMGVGKSTIGKRLSQYLDIPFVDADKEIEKAAGMSVQDIFDQFGEEAFRTGEQKVIKRLMGEGQKILATGGGAFMNENIRQDIEEGGVSVWLNADIDILMKRVQRRADRPLLKTEDPEATMRALLDERNPVYALADVKIESRTVSRDVIAGEVVDLLAEKLPDIAEERGWK